MIDVYDLALLRSLKLAIGMISLAYVYRGRGGRLRLGDNLIIDTFPAILQNFVTSLFLIEENFINRFALRIIEVQRGYGTCIGMSGRRRAITIIKEN